MQKKYMFLIELPDLYSGILGVRFEYKTIDYTVRKGRKSWSEQRRATLCHLSDINSDGTDTVGGFNITMMSVCSPLDQFSRKEGRERSLKKVIEFIRHFYGTESLNDNHARYIWTQLFMKTDLPRYYAMVDSGQIIDVIQYFDSNNRAVTIHE